MQVIAITGFIYRNIYYEGVHKYNDVDLGNAITPLI